MIAVPTRLITGEVFCVQNNLSTTYQEIEMIKKGSVIKIKPNYQDEGDDQYTWTAMSEPNQYTGCFKALVTGGSFPSVMELYEDQVEVCES